MPIEAEAILAAQHQGYTWKEYQALRGAPWWGDSDCKAEVIARFRLVKLYENVLQDLASR